MNSTKRGIIVFFSVMATVVFWMPLSNSPRIAPAGGTITETYFGVFRYATMHAVMKEPEFSLKWTLAPSRLAVTIAVTLVFWGVILWWIRRSPGDRAEAE